MLVAPAMSRFTLRVAAFALLLPACGAERPAAPGPEAAAPVPTGPVRVGPEVASFYREAPRRRIWIAGGRLRPEAREFARVLAAAASHGLDPERYGIADIQGTLASAATGDARALDRAELLLSRAFADFVRDLRTPSEAGMVFAEPGLAQTPPPVGELLEAAAAAPALRGHLAAALRMNPVYEGLRRGLVAYRRRWSALPQVQVPAGPVLGPDAQGERVALLRRRLGLRGGDRFDAELARAVQSFRASHGLPGGPIADEATIAALNAGGAHYERIILANLERARAIPAHSGRFVLVDAAAARLWMFEGARPAGWMRVIVGKRGMETPALAARLRFAVLNPYWNLPADLARDRARRVLRQGTRALAAERLQILSQFSDADRVLSPSSVNWRAVASGRESLRLRQLPGGANVMGAIKFMMPNNLDIYLHDFPDKALFARADRRISSGCVRLEDAPRLARWLFGGSAPQPSGPRPEQRVDLPEPVPVYITYLTAVPAGGEIAFQPDLYGRDAALLAALARARGS